MATGPKSGIVEWIHPAIPVEDLPNHDIGAYLKKELEAHDRAWKEVLSSFVKSCAGYCVITYLLGIGDRHLHNLLIRPTGQLFHVDFGWILGAEPKLFNPPFKLNTEMVRAMGGESSEEYRQFGRLCCESFRVLRRHANLFCNMFALMATDGCLQHLPNDMEKNELKLLQNFHLDLSEEAADRKFRDLIKTATSAVYKLPDYMHRISQTLTAH